MVCRLLNSGSFHQHATKFFMFSSNHLLSSAMSGSFMISFFLAVHISFYFNNSSRLYASTLSQKSDISRNSFVFEHVHACVCLPIKSPKNRCQIKIQMSGLRTNWIARQQLLPFCSSYKEMHEIPSPRQNCDLERAQKGVPFCKLYLPTLC